MLQGVTLRFWQSETEAAVECNELSGRVFLPLFHCLRFRYVLRFDFRRDTHGVVA